MRRVYIPWHSFWLRRRIRRLLRSLVATLVILLSVVVTAGLMSVLTLVLGEISPNQPQATSAAAARDKFKMHITNNLSDALEGIQSIQKIYWLSDKEPVAPPPNPVCYGETSDPDVLKQLLEDASSLLEGQTLYFNPDGARKHGSTVRYYLDDTIFAVAWKEIHDSCVYTFSEVKIAHPSQFRRFLSDGEYGSDKQYLTTEMATSVNAVVASSGDFYRHREFGAVVYEGQVRRVRGDLTDTCLIDENGDLHFFYKGEVLDVETAQAYVDEHNIRFSLAFGPVLIDNGERCVPHHYLLGEIDEEYARAGLCQMDKLHYLLAVANTEGAYQQVPTLFQFTTTLETTGCNKAYALDGGQTAVIAMNDQLVNRPVKGTQRRISDIIYFATAIPSAE